MTHAADDNPGRPPDGPDRAARARRRWLVFWALIVAAGSIYLGSQKKIGDLPMPRCIFHDSTGWYCPGCGSGRAVYALLRLRPLAAWRANPLLMIALPVLLFYGLRWIWPVIRLRPPRPAMTSLGRKTIYLIAAVVALFWITRNLPWWPWTLLAPR